MKRVIALILALCMMFVCVVGALAEETANHKQETLYVLSGADGSVNRVIVSTRIYNASGANEITDLSDLTNVEVVKGDATFTQKEGVITFEANGQDVYYRGDSTKELPVSVSFAYTLDGIAADAASLAGKIGKVQLNVSYTNNTTVDIQGAQINVPFLMLTGMVLDSKVFTNISVTNAEIIDMGDTIIVLGYGLPGMQANLDTDKVTVPEGFTVSADVNGFAMENTVTVAAPIKMDNVDLSKLDNVDAITASVDHLLSQLPENMDVNQLQSNIEQLADGASTLSANMETLANGLLELTANNETLNNGAKQVFETLLATAQTQLAASGLTVETLTVENYNDVLTALLNTLSEDAVSQQARAQVEAAARTQVEAAVKEQVIQAVREQVTAAVNEKVVEGAREQVVAAAREKVEALVRPQVEAAALAQVTDGARAQVTAAVEEQVTAAVREKVTEQVLSAMNMTADAYQKGITAGQVNKETQDKVNAAVDAQMAGNEVQATIKEQMASDEIKKTIDAQMASDTVKAGIQAQMSSDEIKALIEQKTKENTDAQMAGKEVSSQVEAAMASDDVKAKIEATKASDEIKAAIDAQMETDEIKATVEQKTAENVEIQMASDAVKAQMDTGMKSEEVQTALAAAKAGREAIGKLIEQMNTYNTFYTGLAAYTAGVATAQEGSAQLSAGATELSGYMAQLNTTASELVKLVTGDDVASIQENVKALLGDMTMDEVKEALGSNYTDVIRRIVTASGMYKGYTGLSESMTGATMMILRTDAIK